MKIGLVCPCFNEEQYVVDFFNSVKEQDIFNNSEFEVTVLFIDGQSTDKTVKLIKEMSKTDSFVKYFDNPQRYVSQALNLAIDYLLDNEFDFMVRLDVHAIYPVNYISSMISAFLSLEKSGKKVGNVGCCVETKAPNNSLKSKIIASSMSSKLGVGSSDFRVNKTYISEPKEVDTVPFGCFRVSMFAVVGKFDEDFIRNQDDEFNHRLKLNGYKVFLISGLSVSYYSRATFKPLYRMFYQYGLFKPMVMKKLGKPSSIRQFVPALFVISIFMALIAALFGFFSPLLFIIILYVVLIFIFSVSIFKKGQNFIGVLLLSFMTLFLIHFSYGYGFIKGLLTILNMSKSDSINSSR